MKISMVCVEDALMNVGFRKMAARMRQLNPDTSIHYITYANYRSLATIILGRYGSAPAVRETFIREMAEPIAHSDIVAFSSMTGYAALTRDVIRAVRTINPRAYVVWGGIHPIIVSEDAIQHADAICTGEGEFAFETFLQAFRDGKDFTTTGNFWFRVKRHGEESIQKNAFLPLMSNEEMSSLPLPHYGRDEWFYEPGRGYVPINRDIYLRYNGLGYNTVWSIGCPFKCTFCGNTKFIENDKSYRKIRHASVQHLIDEISQARAIHPHISTIIFHDDSFMALPADTLAHFSMEYKRQVDLPFAVYGVIPNYVKEEKFKILLEAGLNRVRMGIQNGSENILKFYERPTPPARVLEAARTINQFKSYMIPPAYDIILDNPIETKDDVVTNLEFLRKLPRPYTLNVYSLRVIPNTVLEGQMRKLNISVDEISANYVGVAPTSANCLVFLLAALPIPDRLFRWWLGKAQPLLAPQTHHSSLLAICRTIYLARRGFDHVKFLDFSVTAGNRLVYLLWKLGLVKFWRRHVIPTYTRKRAGLEEANELAG